MPFSRTDVPAGDAAGRSSFLQAHVDASSRIFATRNTIPYNWEAQFRLATPSRLPVPDPSRRPTSWRRSRAIRTPGVIELRHDLLLETALAADRLPGREVPGGARAQRQRRPRSPSTRTGSVPVFDDGSVQIFENSRALPRAHLVPCGGIEIQEFQRRAISRVNSPAFDHATDGDPGREDRLPCRQVVCRGRGRRSASPPRWSRRRSTPTSSAPTWRCPRCWSTPTPTTRAGGRSWTTARCRSSGRTTRSRRSGWTRASTWSASSSTRGRSAGAPRSRWRGWRSWRALLGWSAWRRPNRLAG